MKPKPKPLADRLRAYRTARGLSQSEAAAALGVNVRTLQGWESGRFEPKGLALEMLNHKLTGPTAGPSKRSDKP